MAEYDITAQITAVLNQYTGEVMDEVDKAVEYCGKGMLKEIKATSPKRTGKYKSGWICAFRTSCRGEKQAFVHNKTNYQLTHLLEHGHAKGRGWGAADPIPHIGPAEETWTRIFEQMGEEACKPK